MKDGEKNMKIFEVQYEINNPDWYQSRVIEVQDWETYVKNVYEYKPHYPFHATIPRTTKPENIIEGDEWLEFDYVVPATRNLRKHRSWVLKLNQNFMNAEMIELENIEKRFNRGYDFSKDSNVTQLFSDMEWLIKKIKEIIK